MSYQDLINANRQTGRTTRMLERAAHWANHPTSERTVVVILGANEPHINHLRTQAAKLIPDPACRKRLRFFTIDQLGDELNLRRMEIRKVSRSKLPEGCDPVVLADHFTLEQHLSAALTELHHYDL